ncbi:hypothetical protein BJ165DRAFT_459625 [Panaeolus papilionaceus]|nr:hypothetical protein BJ165DRAFT_459625 [Panaeolus papilionaceus]
MSRKTHSNCRTSQSLPYELITEISTYLSYTDVQSFRVTSKLFNTVLESTALSHLTLSWACCDASHPEFTPFPLEKITAYIEPGRTRGFLFVRQLRIERVCGYLESRHCPLDKSLGIKDDDFEEEPKVAGMTPWSIVEKRSEFVWYLMRKLILGEALANLKTIVINTDVALCFNTQIGHDPSEPLHKISKLLSERRRPVETCRINIHPSYHGTLSHSPVDIPHLEIPPCKELCIRGFDGAPFVRGPLPLIGSVLNASLHLEGLNIDAPCNEQRLKSLFPSRSMTRTGANVPQLRRLRLIYTGFILEPHYFAHLRGLRRLEVHTVVLDLIEPSTSSAHRRHLSSLLWPQLLNRNKFVPELCIAFDEVEDNALEYLKAYPPATLLSLTIYSRTRYLPVAGCERGLRETPRRFYAEVLPLLSPWLENLVIDTDVVDDWCLGKLDESVESLKGCTRLKSVHVTVDPQCEFERRMELLRNAFGGLRSLISVAVAEARLGFGRLHDIEMRDLV